MFNLYPSDGLDIKPHSKRICLSGVLIQIQEPVTSSAAGPTKEILILSLFLYLHILKLILGGIFMSYILTMFNDKETGTPKLHKLSVV